MLQFKGTTANTRRWPGVGIMLGQRRRRWTNIIPELCQRLFFFSVQHDSYLHPSEVKHEGEVQRTDHGIGRPHNEI